ncbi:MAG: 3-deoxy-D-manno-octulosonic acid transferase [Candidatus Omnitrophota bacterium]
MTLIYDIIFIILHLIYFPIFLFKRKLHKGFLSRLGFLPKELTKLKDKDYIWIHAVSVGEALVVSKLLDVLRKQLPDKKLLISTVTPTGNKIARSLIKNQDIVIYFPLDLSLIVRKFVNRINPCVFVTAETEIWPNIINYLHKRRIPIIIINGRISKRSFKGYRKIRYFLKGILNKISLFCMQTLDDAEKIIYLGADKDKVKVIGNLKFDETFPSHSYQTTDLGLKKDDRLLIAGSTHSNEEEIIIRVYKNILRDYPRLKLMIAPRHIDRVNSIIELIKANNFKVIKFSKVKNEQLNLTAYSNYIFLVDTIGDLKTLYNLATIVFVGGSLVNKGGHNIIEPGYFGKPIIFGPNMSNFQDMTDTFLSRKAAIQVKDEQGLQKNIKMLFDNNVRTQTISKNAKEVVEENRGATERTVNLLKEILKF